MIITQTPLRVSFFGGGTDFPDFYHREEGCVLSTAIDKYIFVIIKRRFDQKIRVGYTKTEMVDSVDEVEHELVRETMRLTGVSRQVEIGTMGDIPSAGSGLGSSGTVTVGLINAMHAYIGDPQSLHTLATQACSIELDRLHKPIGKQDQYIATFGGFRFIRFLPDESVSVEKVELSDNDRRRFNQNLMLFFTNTTRRSERVLKEQVANINNNLSVLRELKSLAFEGKHLLEGGEFDEFGRLLHYSWNIKKQLAKNITNNTIDEIYTTALNSGAYGGKITGAGGGGFLLLYCPVEKQQAVRSALKEFTELPFNLEPEGSKVIFNYVR
jgi:D-glycero-alpha-D-manno-heptose-7-phosphate kinase